MVSIDRAPSVWKAILAEQVALLGPQAVRGPVLFEITTAPVTRFFVAATGGVVRLLDGACPQPAATVRATTEAVEQLLSSDTPPRGALRVWGDMDAFRSLFEALSQLRGPMGLVALRNLK